MPLKSNKTIDESKIGSGGYGCVTKPAIKCKNNKLSQLVKRRLGFMTDRIIRDSNVTPELYKNRVSKIMRKDDAYEEYQIASLLEKNKLIPKQEILYCEPDEKGLARNLGKCTSKKLKSERNKDLRILLPRYRGISSYSVYRNSKFRKQSAKVLYTAFLKAIGFMKRLHRHKDDKGVITRYIHGDIKPDNILYDIDSGKFTVIDYGFTKPYDKLFEDNLSVAGYFVFPFDYGIISIICDYHKYKKVLSKRLDYYIKARKSEYFPPCFNQLMTSHRLFQNGSNTYHNKCKDRVTLAITNLTNNYHKTVQLCKNVRAGLHTGFARRFDVLGLGYTLCYIMKTMDKDYLLYKTDKKRRRELQYFYDELKELIRLCINQNIMEYPDMSSYVGQRTPTVTQLYTKLKALILVLN